MTEDDDDMPVHVHKFHIRVLIVSLTLIAARRGMTTNLTINLTLWRLGANFGLSYYGN